MILRESLLRKALAAQPQSPGVTLWYHGLGKIYEEEKRWQQAIDVYRAALAVNNRDAEIHIVLDLDPENEEAQAAPQWLTNSP